MPNRVAIGQELPNITESEALFARARGLIPAGTQTLAKGPTQFVEGVAPTYLARGSGCRVWDVAHSKAREPAVPFHRRLPDKSYSRRETWVVSGLLTKRKDSPKG